MKDFHYMILPFIGTVSHLFLNSVRDSFTNINSTSLGHNSKWLMLSQVFSWLFLDSEHVFLLQNFSKWLINPLKVKKKIHQIDLCVPSLEIKPDLVSGQNIVGMKQLNRSLSCLLTLVVVQLFQLPGRNNNTIAHLRNSCIFHIDMFATND